MKSQGGQLWIVGVESGLMMLRKEIITGLHEMQGAPCRLPQA